MWRLRLLNAALRYAVKPALARARSPEAEARKFEHIGPRVCPPPPFTCHLTEEVADLSLHWVSVGKPAPQRVILYLHGGAYFAGSGRAYRGFLGRIAKATGLRVCAPDYRLLQDAPFPAAFDDALAAWEVLIGKGFRAEDIVLGGDSAGGGLMLALLAQLCEGRTPPAACFAFSPWTDLTLGGATIRAETEVILPAKRMGEVVDRYLQGARAEDPRASPLFARFAAAPPVSIHVGGGEVLLDDGRRMAARLGANADLRIRPDLPHVWPFFSWFLPLFTVRFLLSLCHMGTANVIGSRKIGDGA